jgi:hypothetical protein
MSNLKTLARKRIYAALTEMRRDDRDTTSRKGINGPLCCYDCFSYAWKKREDSMRLEDDIAETAVRVCDQLASAVERYAAVSGSAFHEVPEGFLRDRVFDGLGDVLTMTSETNNTKLWDWNADARRRSNGQPVGTPAPSQPEDFKNSKRPDLVIFKGDHPKKSETDFLCLVEIKKWWDIDRNEQILCLRDLTKIDNWFHWLDTCPHGMLCAFAEVPNENFIEYLKTEALKAGHQWITGRIARPLEVSENYQTFARILTNRNFRR